MLASPYISGFRAATETMYDKVREVDELLELWTSCQSKVCELHTLTYNLCLICRFLGSHLYVESGNSEGKKCRNVSFSARKPHQSEGIICKLKLLSIAFVSCCMSCFLQWIYLMKVFEDAKIYSRMSTQAFAFESVHSHMKEIQKSVIADPGGNNVITFSSLCSCTSCSCLEQSQYSFLSRKLKPRINVFLMMNIVGVMSITTHTRGSKGYKVLQGDYLRTMFTDMIKTQVWAVQCFLKI